MKKPHIKHTFRLEADLSRKMAERASSRRVSKTEVVEAALASLLSPDDEQRIEAVLARRLDRICFVRALLAYQQCPFTRQHDQSCTGFWQEKMGGVRSDAGPPDGSGTKA